MEVADRFHLSGQRFHTTQVVLLSRVLHILRGHIVPSMMGRSIPLCFAVLVVVSKHFMSSEFALDLRVVRRQAGFTQADVAVLLGVHQSHVSDLEQGRTLPTLAETVSLSLVFGRSFESLFGEIMQIAKQDIGERLSAIPKTMRSYTGTFNRDSSLKKLARRLEADPYEHGAE
jgi:transcriptional regulator with XRE-family HTH domain